MCNFIPRSCVQSSNNEETFRVSICAMEMSSYVVWQRSELEYLFVKEPYLAQVLSAIISKDITDKLFAMNEQLALRKNGEDGVVGGPSMDIRLPGVAGGLSRMNNRDHTNFRNNNFVC